MVELVIPSYMWILVMLTGVFFGTVPKLFANVPKFVGPLWLLTKIIINRKSFGQLLKSKIPFAFLGSLVSYKKYVQFCNI